MSDSDSTPRRIHGDASFWNGDLPDEIVLVHDDREETRLYRADPGGEA
jgi:hypothetical protein